MTLNKPSQIRSLVILTNKNTSETTLCDTKNTMNFKLLNYTNHNISEQCSGELQTSNSYGDIVAIYSNCYSNEGLVTNVVLRLSGFTVIRIINIILYSEMLENLNCNKGYHQYYFFNHYTTIY